MTYLLFLEGHQDGHGLRPRSLKFATISTLTGEVTRGRENLSRLAIRCNYRAFAAQDADKVYSRNSAQRQIFVPKFAQKEFRGNKAAESISDDPSVFSEECLLGETPPGAEFQGRKPADWERSMLKNGKHRAS